MIYKSEYRIRINAGHCGGWAIAHTTYTSFQQGTHWVSLRVFVQKQSLVPTNCIVPRAWRLTYIYSSPPVWKGTMNVCVDNDSLPFSSSLAEIIVTKGTLHKCKQCVLVYSPQGIKLRESHSHRHLKWWHMSYTVHWCQPLYKLRHVMTVESLTAKTSFQVRDSVHTLTMFRPRCSTFTL